MTSLIELQTVNEELVDRAILQATRLERLKAAEANRILRFLQRDVMPDLTARAEAALARGPLSRTSRRYVEMIAANRATLGSGYSVAYKTLKSKLGELALTESEVAAAGMRAATRGIIQLDLVTPAPALLRSIVTSDPMRGDVLRGWFDKLARGTQDKVTRAINVGIATGDSSQQIAARLAPILRTSTKQAAVISRTAVTHVAARAREETYKANDDVVKGVQWLSTLDARTSDICMSLDGRVFKVGEGIRPPAHHQCRSTTVPVMKSFKELAIEIKGRETPGTRASMNGQVAARTTYPKWLKRQNAATQNEALGVAKAKLFRKGVPLQKLTGTSVGQDLAGRPLTLEQVRARTADVTFGSGVKDIPAKIAELERLIIEQKKLPKTKENTAKLRSLQSSLSRFRKKLGVKPTPPTPPKPRGGLPQTADDFERVLLKQVDAGKLPSVDFGGRLLVDMDKLIELYGIQGGGARFEALKTGLDRLALKHGKLRRTQTGTWALPQTADRVETAIVRLLDADDLPMQARGSQGTVVDTGVLMRKLHLRADLSEDLLVWEQAISKIEQTGRLTRDAKGFLRVTPPVPPHIKDLYLQLDDTIAKIARGEGKKKSLQSKASVIRRKIREAGFDPALRPKTLSSVDEVLPVIPRKGVKSGRQVREGLEEQLSGNSETIKELRREVTRLGNEMFDLRDAIVAELQLAEAGQGAVSGPMALARRARSDPRYLRAKELYERKQKLLLSAATDQKEMVRQALLVEDPIKITLDKTGKAGPFRFSDTGKRRRGPGPEYMAKAEKAARFVESVTSRSTGTTQWEIGLVSKRGRAFCQSDVRRASSPAPGGKAVGRITLDPYDDVSVFAHEIGHAIDNQSRNRQTRAFLKRRADADKRGLRKLSDITGRRYDSHEMAWEDEFIEAYMGKHYAHGSSELLSMGLEFLMKDPLKLMRQDPEYFDWLIDTLRNLN